ncbi:compound eye opsin BCRH1-like [Penaeus chinensis]|uniref:compound eye opsin BCRH1-like n=1 Tax=Penaeus chinensis TaxID=139456 RepID=UPI001FB584E7|nr:compound eye opsin BCRH1-like [Penaeus chinensis]
MLTSWRQECLLTIPPPQNPIQWGFISELAPLSEPVAPLMPPTLRHIYPDDVKPLIHSHWSNFPPVNPMWHYMLAGIHVFLGLLSFFGNGIVMYLFLSKKSLRSPANMFVVNLSFSDFMMMASQFPVFFMNCFSGGYWSLGAFACEVYGFLGSVFGMTSVMDR